jgi:acetyl-CoA carboxylase carboxyl transferase subunit beta
MTFKELFERKKMATLPSADLAKYEKIDVPSSMWMQCPGCKGTIYKKGAQMRMWSCPSCGAPFRLSSSERIEMICDQGSFVSLDEKDEVSNPIDFPGYTEKIDILRKRTGLSEAVVTGTCEIDGVKCVIGIMDSNFMMGSMGHIVGERITRAFEYATENLLPVVIFTASGGARMQEGTISLMQMAKTSGAVKRHSDTGLLYVSVLTDPTTGGVTASFAMLGDIILAEKGALVGFAGKRVISQTTGEKLPDNFQRAEFVMECGFVDMVCERSELKDVLGDILNLHRED